MKWLRPLLLMLCATALFALAWSCGSSSGDDDDAADDDAASSSDDDDNDDDGSCRSDKDCPGQICADAIGRCADCAQDADCDEDEICAGFACRPACEVDSDCDDGESCSGGVCLTGCRSSKECDDQVCDVDAGVCRDCLRDADCADDEVCLDGFCVETSGGFSTQDDDNDDDADDNFVDDDTSGDPPRGCAADRDCKGGEICNHGLCETFNPGADDDSADDDSADDDSASDDDFTQPPMTCANSQVCVGGYDCINGSCQPAGTTSCTPGTPETCDGVDNDCNGKVDDMQWAPTDIEHCGDCFYFCDRLPNMFTECDLGRCKWACAPGMTDSDKNPSNGCEAGICQPTNGGVETCDYIDNDCNGKVDDGDLCPPGKHCNSGRCWDSGP